MEKSKNIIIILIIFVILVCIIGSGVLKKKSSQLDQNEIEIEYNTTKDEMTGKTQYQIYDKNTGKKIGEVEDESLIKQYEDNPTYDEFAPTIIPERESDMIETIEE